MANDVSKRPFPVLVSRLDNWLFADLLLLTLLLYHEQVAEGMGFYPTSELISEFRCDFRGSRTIECGGLKAQRL
jgi:hypothetical protein